MDDQKSFFAMNQRLVSIFDFDIFNTFYFSVQFSTISCLIFRHGSSCKASIMGFIAT